MEILLEAEPRRLMPCPRCGSETVVCAKCLQTIAFTVWRFQQRPGKAQVEMWGVDDRPPNG